MIKVAHWVEVGLCGQYRTVKDLVKAEREAGLDARIIDFHMLSKTEHKWESRRIEGSEDIEWAKEADVYIRHTFVPKEYRDLGKPIIMCCHGRPESTFRLSRSGQIKLHHEFENCFKNDLYKAFVSFWPEYVYINKTKFGDKFHHIPICVDLDYFHPEGEKWKWKNPGKINLLVCDIWREDVIPYYTLYKAAEFIENSGLDAKLHIVGLSAYKHGSVQYMIKKLRERNVIGDVLPLIKDLRIFARAADVILTPNVIDTRIVREAMACGCPVVKGFGRTEFINSEETAFLYNLCSDKIDRDVIRAEAEDMFNPKVTGAKMKELVEKVLHQPKAWTEGDVAMKNQDYDEYLEHQKSKLNNKPDFVQAYDKKYEENLTKRILDFGETHHYLQQNVLCLGARLGAEVRAFKNAGHFAIGIDLNPGKDNEHVLVGDFHDLKFPNGSVDICFTNSVDHVFDIEVFKLELCRVLKHHGLFIVDLEKPYAKGKDKYSSLWWKTKEDFIKLFEDKLDLIDEIDVDFKWFCKMLVFEKRG